jgi:hypothetical protein
VIQHAKVVTIFWNANVQFQAELKSFYGAIINSAYTAWLSEYDTTTPAQTISGGTFLQATVDSGSPTATEVDDAQIQSELARLIDSGGVAHPDANTVYTIHFPPGVSITQGGSRSCEEFCEYHGTLVYRGINVPYTVIPDQGGACAGGCGANPSLLNNLTSVSSHALVEAITDPDIGLASSDAAPMAWMDPVNGEIGDICNAQQGTVTGSDGNAYTVQKEWSNQLGQCIVEKSALPPPHPPRHGRLK